MKYGQLFAEIAKLAELHLNDGVPLEYSDEVRQGFLVNVDTGVLLSQKNPAQPERLFQLVDKSITDLLGDYFPEERKIVIYTGVCEATADALAIPYNALEHVVVTHEISHAVTHVGEEGFRGSGVFWEWYPYADLWDKELFAQLYPFFYFSREGSEELLDIFCKLSANQLPIYNSWQLYRHTPITEVNRLLSLTRQKRFCAWIDMGPAEAKSLAGP